MQTLKTDRLPSSTTIDNCFRFSKTPELSGFLVSTERVVTAHPLRAYELSWDSRIRITVISSVGNYIVTVPIRLLFITQDMKDAKGDNLVYAKYSETSGEGFAWNEDASLVELFTFHEGEGKVHSVVITAQELDFLLERLQLLELVLVDGPLDQYCQTP